VKLVLVKISKISQCLLRLMCPFLFPDSFGLTRFNLLLGKELFFFCNAFLVLRSSVLIYFSVCYKLTGDGNKRESVSSFTTVLKIFSLHVTQFSDSEVNVPLHHKS